MRLSEIADHIAPHLNRGPDAVHAALRNPHVKGCLSGTPGPTPKSPVHYDYPEVVRAFVLLAAQASDIEGSELTKVNSALNECSAALMDKPGGFVSNGLGEMMQSIRNGHTDWHLAVRFVVSTNGGRSIVVRLERGEMQVQARRVARVERNVKGDLTVGYTFIPLGDLLSPLLSGRA